MNIIFKALSLASLLNIFLFLKFIKTSENESEKNQNVLGDVPPLYKAEYQFFEINNMRCLYIQNKKIKRSAVAMAVDCGSQNDTIPGLAHLLEHLLFISPEQDEKTTETKKMNEFSSYLSLFAGSSDAFTSDKMTVFHYELDSKGLEKSLEIFAKFFKNPKINPKTVESEIKTVDSEFQSYKFNEPYRLQRLREILAGKTFRTGNINSFGLDYEKVAREAKELHEKFYKKMVLVVCSELPLDDIKPTLDRNFTLQLDELKYVERKCLYCEKKAKTPDVCLKINKIAKLKAVTDLKRVYISIPLILVQLLPYNIYDSLDIFLIKMTIPHLRPN